MYDSSSEQLHHSFHRHAVLEGVHGGHMVILEKGARVWALISSGRHESPFWTDKAALGKETWNTGGDRTWISPELDYFIDSSGEYRVPSQLDPGNWRMTERENESIITLEQTFRLCHHSSGQEVGIHMQKQFSTIPNPLLTNKSDTDEQWADLDYIGYEMRQQMTVLPSEQDDQSVKDNQSRLSFASGYCNLWSIMQVPVGGTALIPTRGYAEPLTMFAEDMPIEMDVRPEGTRLPFQGKRSYKLSFDSLQSTGRFGYIRTINELNSSLVIRQFPVYPASIYPDYPADRTTYQGSCMQFYFDGGQMGGFGELEYHSPAVFIDTPSVTTDTSQLYYFVGKTTQIHKVVNRMLGLNI